MIPDYTSESSTPHFKILSESSNESKRKPEIENQRENLKKQEQDEKQWKIERSLMAFKQEQDSDAGDDENKQNQSDDSQRQNQQKTQLSDSQEENEQNTQKNEQEQPQQQQEQEQEQEQYQESYYLYSETQTYTVASTSQQTLTEKMQKIQKYLSCLQENQQKQEKDKQLLEKQLHQSIQNNQKADKILKHLENESFRRKIIAFLLNKFDDENQKKKDEQQTEKQKQLEKGLKYQEESENSSSVQSLSQSQTQQNIILQKIFPYFKENRYQISTFFSQIYGEQKIRLLGSYQLKSFIYVFRDSVKNAVKLSILQKKQNLIKSLEFFNNVKKQKLLISTSDNTVLRQEVACIQQEIEDIQRMIKLVNQVSKFKTRLEILRLKLQTKEKNKLFAEKVKNILIQQFGIEYTEQKSEKRQNKNDGILVKLQDKQQNEEISQEQKRKRMRPKNSIQDIAKELGLSTLPSKKIKR